MSTTLGPTLIVRTMTALCDGQCGGTIEVATDGVHVAAVTTSETEGQWAPGHSGTPALFSLDPFRIEAYCASQHGRSLDWCTGAALFGRDDFDAATWQPAAPYGTDLIAMDRA